MNMKSISPSEFKAKDEVEAELVAILSGRVPYFEEVSGEHRVLDEKDIRSKIKKFYEENRYEDAEDLIDTLDKFDSMNVEKELREIKSKSFRLSDIQFVNLVKKAYRRDISISDIIRSNISDKLEGDINKLCQDQNLDQSKIDVVKEIIEEWAEKKGRSPKDDGYQINHNVPYRGSKKKYKRLSKYLMKKKLKEMGVEDEKFINILLNHYDLPDDIDFGPFVNFTITERDDKIRLKFNLEFYYAIREGGFQDLLLDIANEGYDERDLNDIPVFNSSELINKIKNIKEGKDEDIEINNTTYWAEVIDEEIGFPNIDIDFPLDIEFGNLKWGDTMLEESNIKEFVLKEVLDQEIESTDLDKAMEQVQEYLDNKEYNKAKRLNQKISIYNSVEYIGEVIEDIILNGFSSHVVSLTMPKCVAGLVKLFDYNKDDFVG